MPNTKKNINYRVDYSSVRDVIWGTCIVPQLMPCDKCHKDECNGEGDCKGYGAYSLGIKS